MSVENVEKVFCKYCKGYDVSLLEESYLIPFMVNVVEVMVRYSFCNYCEYEFVSQSNILYNDNLIKEAKDEEGCDD